MMAYPFRNEGLARLADQIAEFVLSGLSVDGLCQITKDHVLRAHVPGQARLGMDAQFLSGVPTMIYSKVPPAFFHALTPPDMFTTGERPISMATRAAMAERPPDAQ